MNGAALQAFNCTLVAHLAHEVDNTICFCVHTRPIIIAKREKCIPFSGKDFVVSQDAYYIKHAVYANIFDINTVFAKMFKLDILMYIQHVDLGYVTESDRCLTQGFKGARDSCFPDISKETFYWLLALIIFWI